jgi:succinate dehydrogenase / fumarate reductase flavoprotein subunit
MEVLNYDIIIVGTGLAGLRAAVEICRKNSRVKVALISKVQIMRAHSVCAEGGTAAVLHPEDGDSFELHAWDTIKGADFLADQDVVMHFVKICPEEMYLLDHWGIPWSRKEDGRINQRPFGGHTYPRATFAEDKTGFFEMQTLYDRLQMYENWDRFEEVFVTKLFIEDGKFHGLFAYDMLNGKFLVLKGKTVILATGGGGRIYAFTTFSHAVTGDGLALAYREGVPLKNMEFMQFHPTGLVPSGILMTEACRGEGGQLRNNKGERFMDRYAPEKMELAPRDIIARAEMTEILEGRGFKGPDGLDYVHLDLTHLGREKILERLPLIREVTMSYIGLDPIEKPIPVRPAQHYTMGGIDVDIDGRSKVPNLFAAGEVACNTLHGANRLGTNSTAECIVWGRITGEKALEFVENEKFEPEIPEGKIKDEEKRIVEFMQKDGKESIYQLRKELRQTMDRYVGVFRDEEGLKTAVNKIREIKQRFKNIKVHDKGMYYNTDLTTALELENMIDVAEVVAVGALERKESRGAHARRDYTKRDDKNYLKHTVAEYTPEGPRISYRDVKITIWKPVERKY